MRLVDLTLVSFRNYESAKLEFGDFNLIVGPNAQGKTNLLEAIHFLATTKSYRAASDADLIRAGDELGYVKGTIEDAFTQRSVEIAIPVGRRKQVKLDGKVVGKLSNLVGLLKVVLFAPETTSVVRGRPSDRRRFLDMMLSQVRSDYLYTLQRYQTALRERNEALRQRRPGGVNRLLEIWDEALVESGAELMRLRSTACEQLRPIVRRQHDYLSENTEVADLRYAPNVPMMEDGSAQQQEFQARLIAAVDTDCARGSTSVGPHRDDVQLEIDESEARRFASQGQQRTLALAMKLAEFEWISEAAGELPVVLLDDVTSELDETRTALLFDVLRTFPPQVFLTTTHLDRSILPDRTAATVWSVSAGTVRAAERST